MVSDVSAALEFLRSAFNAEVQNDEDSPNFASTKLGNAMMFITSGRASHGHLPQAASATSLVSLHLYLGDVVAAIDKAVAVGAALISKPRDMSAGKRTAALADPFWHRWRITERTGQLPKEERPAGRQKLVNDDLVADHRNGELAAASIQSAK